MTRSASTRQSARVRAQRPQLVPRERDVAVPFPPTQPEADDDPDVAAVRGRTGRILQAWEFGEDNTVGTEVELPASPVQPEAPAPVPAPAPALTSTVALRPITYEDIDRLWDWCRQDPTGAGKYLGHVPTHSFALQQYMSKQLTMQDGGTARVCAIDIASERGPMHMGFVSLLPINRVSVPPVGVAHCYLRPEAQGALPQLMPQMLDEAARLEPTLTLMVSVDDYAFARLLQPFGFTLTITLTRPPAHAQG